MVAQGYLTKQVKVQSTVAKATEESSVHKTLTAFCFCCSARLNLPGALNRRVASSFCDLLIGCLWKHLYSDIRDYAENLVTLYDCGRPGHTQVFDALLECLDVENTQVKSVGSLKDLPLQVIPGPDSFELVVGFELRRTISGPPGRLEEFTADLFARDVCHRIYDDTQTAIAELRLEDVCTKAEVAKLNSLFENKRAVTQQAALAA